jgi:hypothetical protein
MRTWAAEIAEYEGEIILQRLVQIVDGDQAVVAVDVTLLAADVTLLKDAFQQLVGKRRQPVEQRRREHGALRICGIRILCHPRLVSAVGIASAPVLMAVISRA